ncbi:hypothetical protein IMZ48_19020 [Candidatus Bathyarchaeota archaeon]|nr:hypothetical protein [Candidatus Bathyarchaeota archaeon]
MSLSTDLNLVISTNTKASFIFNRLWAAIKREILQILAEGVSSAGQIDMLWEHMFRAETLPCKMMDQIGLDTVAFIEDNYIKERDLDGANTVDWLRENYISQGRTGQKSGNGGLYPNTPSISPAVNGCNGTHAPNGTSAPSGHGSERKIYALDVGLGGNLKSLKDFATNGKILRINPSTGRSETVIAGLSLPDGIDVSHSAGRIFWTNMGGSTSARDGSVMSSNLDGSDSQVLIPTGQVHTPKQLVVAEKSRKLYFCDREGTSVHRCDFDGKDHEVLVSHQDKETDMTDWCVGIAVDEGAGKIYWTQKGPSKAGKGRIFRAGVEIPSGESAGSRSDVELLFENLSEPIDLELDTAEQALYWTDRGEHPLGCSLNRVSLGACGSGEKVTPEILARHFHEPIGLKLDVESHKVYVADLGGSVYAVDLDTREKTVVHRDDGSYTGIALV